MENENNVAKGNEHHNDGKLLTKNVSTMIKGLIEIGSCDIDDFDLNLTLAEIVKELSRVESAYMKSAKSIVKKYVKINENGVPVTEGEGAFRSYVYNTVEDEKKYIDEMEKLNETEITTIKSRIKATQLKNIKGVKSISIMKIGNLMENDVNYPQPKGV
jgi:hypothetical protein